VSIADDPFDETAIYGLGNLARRTVLIFEQAFKSKNNLPISNFLQLIRNPDFDKPTSSATTRSEPANPKINLIKMVKSIRTNQAICSTD
jgi:hypothetical protein